MTVLTIFIHIYLNIVYIYIYIKLILLKHFCLPSMFLVVNIHRDDI